MKRKGNLITEIASINNLYLAWHKAKKSKMVKPDVLAFEQNLEKNVQRLKHQIESRQPIVGNYKYFTIRDPKKRTICAAAFPERVLHHALMNICHPIFEKHLIFDTYATRKHKGTYAALNRARFYLKKHTFFAKMDVRKYFDTINHEILLGQLSRLFKDNNLLGVFIKIIGSYQTGHNTGLPIGNLTSQYFANHYLSQADHYALQNLKVPAFIRYMDDILLFDSNKEGLKIKTEQFVKYLHEKLKLEVKPVIYGQNQNGLPFLGYKLFPQTIKLNQRSKKRFKRKLKTYSRFVNSGIWSEKEFQEHVLPLLSFIRYADTFHFRKNCTFALQG